MLSLIVTTVLGAVIVWLCILIRDIEDSLEKQCHINAKLLLRVSSLNSQLIALKNKARS